MCPVHPTVTVVKGMIGRGAAISLPIIAVTAPGVSGRWGMFRGTAAYNRSTGDGYASAVTDTEGCRQGARHGNAPLGILHVYPTPRQLLGRWSRGCVGVGPAGHLLRWYGQSGGPG